MSRTTDRAAATAAAGPRLRSDPALRPAACRPSHVPAAGTRLSIPPDRGTTAPVLALTTTVGVAIILVVLRDVVHELFHPEQRGSLSALVMAGTWHVVKLTGHRWRGALTQAGPLALLAVAGVWTMGLVLGWSCIYWPRLPGDFHTASGLPPAATHGFVTALYISLAALTGTGASDITPVVGWLRIATMLESLVGLGMITAWITWVLSIYPVLAERRAFARKIALLRSAEASPERAVEATPPDILAPLLGEIAAEVVHVDAQFRQSAVTYYFHQRSPDATLPDVLPYVLALARAAEQSTVEAIRYQGRLLRRAVELLVTELARRFLGRRSGSCEELLAALARDHLRDDEPRGP